MSKVFLPKEDQELPDHYKMIVNYVTGKKDEFKVASHKFHPESRILDVWLEDNVLRWIIVDNTTSIEFDKNFTKVLEISRKLEREKKNVG